MHYSFIILITSSILAIESFAQEPDKKLTDGNDRVEQLDTANSLSKVISDKVKKQATTSTVVIRTGTGGGSGFIVEDKGRKFVITNQHVLLGNQKQNIKITTTDGAVLQPIALQIVPKLDLARIEVKEAPPALLFASSATIDDTVATVGNSLDAGVITVNIGNIVGVGNEEIEVDCESVPGQSGGPLVNSAGNVIGVTTYILYADKDKDTEDTRYAKKRYFTVRVSADTPWTTVGSWDEYERVGLIVKSGEEVFEEAIKIAVSADGGPDEDYEYAGKNIRLTDAVKHHNRFVQKMMKMDGDVGTSKELDRNNSSLSTSFRSVYKAIIDACDSEKLAMQREIDTGRIRFYPWHLERSKETVEMLAELSKSLDSRSKARPRFLTWE
jgi:hypothetical protein